MLTRRLACRVRVLRQRKECSMQRAAENVPDDGHIKYIGHISRASEKWWSLGYPANNDAI